MAAMARAFGASGHRGSAAYIGAAPRLAGGVKGRRRSGGKSGSGRTRCLRRPRRARAGKGKERERGKERWKRGHLILRDEAGKAERGARDQDEAVEGSPGSAGLESASDSCPLGAGKERGKEGDTARKDRGTAVILGEGTDTAGAGPRRGAARAQARRPGGADGNER